MRAAEAIGRLPRYPAMRDSGVAWLGEVPEHWEVRRNGRLFAQRNETGFAELPILEVSLRTGVRIRDFEGSDRKQIMSDRAKYKRALAGDIAYNMMRMWQGAVGVAPADGLVSPAYVVARPLRGIHAGYFERLFRTPHYMQEVDDCSRGIVKDRNRLYWEDFKAIRTCYPPPREQAAIVRYLDHVDRRVRRLVRAKRKLIALLTEQKQAIIHRAVTRGLDPNVPLKDSGVEWLGEVPEHWEIWQLGHFCRIGNGSTPSRGNAAYWARGHYPWLNSSYANHEVVFQADQFVTATALEECHLPIVPPGSLLVGITGQGKTRGKAALLGMEATINQHLAYITPMSAVASGRYLQRVLDGAYLHLRAISDDSGSTKGALTCADLKHFRVALPSVSEQISVVEYLDEASVGVDTAIGRANREIDLLNEYRTRLIADVVTGKLDVRAAAAALPDVDPLDTEADGDDAPDPDTDADTNDLDATPEDAEA